MILFCFQETSLLGGSPHFQNLHALFVSSGGSKHLLHHFYHRKLGRWQSNLRSIWYVLNGWLNPQRVVLSFYQGRKMKDGCSVETKITPKLVEAFYVGWKKWVEQPSSWWWWDHSLKQDPWWLPLSHWRLWSKQRRAEILDIIDAGNVEKWLTTPSRIGVCGAKSSFFPTSYAMTGMYVLKTNHL